APGAHRERVGRIREQAQGAILSLDGGRAAPAAAGNSQLEPHGRHHCRNPGDSPGRNVKALAKMRSWMHGTVRRSDLERGLEDELRFHIESYTTDLERAGCTGGGAQTRARRFRKRRGSAGTVPRCTRAPAARSAGDGWPVRMPAT